MKNNIITILKYTMIDGLKLNKSKSKEKISGDTVKKRAKIYFGIGILIFFYVFMYFDMFYDSYKPNGLENYILPVFMALTCFMVFIYSIRLTESVLFKSKDYEFLTSMPIKQSTILTTKIIYLLIINYYISLLVIVPASILFMEKEGLTIAYVLINILMALLVPLIPIVLGALLAILVGVLATKFKYTNVITTIFTMLLFVACIFLPQLFSEDLMSSMTIEKFDNIFKCYYPLYMAKDILVTYNIPKLIAFVLGNLGIFVLFLLAVSKTYGKINQKLKETFRVGKFKEHKYVTRTSIYAMTAKEVKKILATPMYFINTCFGPVLLLLASIYIFFAPTETIYQIAIKLGMATIPPYIVIALVLGITGFACTTGSSISLEGKYLWIYKTTPVKVNDIFNSKIYANLIVVLPFILLSVILISTKIGMDKVSFILSMILPVISLAFTAVLGVVVNLKYVWLDFESEIYVIKRSSASMISMFIPMILIIIGISIVLSMPNIKLAYIIYAETTAVVTYIIYRFILLKWGVKKFNNLGN